MQVNSSSDNTYTSASYSNKGISGMNSGLDTEGLVKSMLNDIQTKIDKQEQKQKVLEMQQEEYRSVIDKINEFKDKYFSVTGEKTLALSSTFKTSNTESSSPAVKAVSTSDAVEGSFDVQVTQLASEAKYVSDVPASHNMNVKLGGDIMGKQATTMEIKAGDRTISVDISGAAGKSEVAELINKGIASYNKTNGTDVTVSASIDSDGKIKFSGTGAYSSVEVSGSTASEKPASVTSSAIDASKFSEEGEEHKLKINGKEITVNLTKDCNVADAINNAVNADSDLQRALNGISFTMDGDKLKIEGSSDVDKITVEGESADLKKFGFSGKQEASRTSSVSVDAPEINTKGKLNISYNGVTKDITITDTDTADSFSEKLFQAFGSGIRMDENGNITAGTGKNIQIKGSADALAYAGIDEKGVSNQISTSQTLGEIYGYGEDEQVKFSINGTNFTFTGNTKLSDMMTEINDSRAGVTLTYNSLNDKFSLTGQEMGDDSVIDASDAAADGSGLLAKMFGSSSFSAVGTNARVNIDGEDIEYAGNEIKYNGINLTLKKVTGNESVNIETSRDNDKALDTIVSFVEDYNKLIKDLNDKIHEKAEYKKYMPLTEAQKDEMSESEIKKWEEKTNKGLLNGDNDISKFLSEMRSVLYTKVGDKKMLSDIGISSSSDWKDYGKLTVDKDKLKDAIQSDIKGVQDIFTGDTGICSRLSDVCKKAANTSSGSPGSLVSLAGMKGKASEKNNTINKRIDGIKDVIKKLKAQYYSRKERLWKQFNSMETALGNMNSTANYFAQMMGGGF